MKRQLDIEGLKGEAAVFAKHQSEVHEAMLFGVTDGKAIGTYLEHSFRTHLRQRYQFEEGNSAKGIDFPSVDVDLKVTSTRQPQSSCPFKSARQKIYGLGYGLLIFTYDKSDDHLSRTGCLSIVHTIYVEEHRTADYQTTSGILRILEHNGTRDDLFAFLQERMLPVDEIGAWSIVDELIAHPPQLGYLTISNALQWRLQYGRAIEQAGIIAGVEKLT
ncbi:MAG: restriction endonuclease [Armatimonadetes bacterium]|nr:restriction endonuclease [Armatimonadota bacterium]